MTRDEFVAVVASEMLEKQRHCTHEFHMLLVKGIDDNANTFLCGMCGAEIEPEVTP